MVKIPKKLNYKYILLGAVTVLVVCLILLLTHHKAKVATIPSANPLDKNSQSSNSNSGSTNGSINNSSASGSSDKSTSGGESQPLALSSAQTLVSNHHPGENGSPTTEQSACQTTPGATCYIEFTQAGLTRKLDAKIADSNGLGVWNWDTKDADFSSGQWKIIAVASLNGQTKSTSDPSPLEIP
jgi:hypothetical protein